MAFAMEICCSSQAQPRRRCLRMNLQRCLRWNLLLPLRRQRLLRLLRQRTGSNNNPRTEIPHRTTMVILLAVPLLLSAGWPHLEQCWHGTSCKFLACCWLNISSTLGSTMRSVVTAVLLSNCKIFMYVLIKRMYVRLN